MSDVNRSSERSVIFFFNDTATTEIYTLSLHDALPICIHANVHSDAEVAGAITFYGVEQGYAGGQRRPGRQVELSWHLRSEEHTSELQSRQYLVCRLLLEKKK